MQPDQQSQSGPPFGEIDWGLHLRREFSVNQSVLGLLDQIAHMARKGERAGEGR